MSERAVAIHPLDAEGFAQWSAAARPEQRRWAEESAGFDGSEGQCCLLPDGQGGVDSVLCGMGKNNLWALASLPDRLPAGRYRIEGVDDPERLAAFALGFELARYRFSRYREQPQPKAELDLEAGLGEDVARMARAVGRVRDLINTPAEDMGPVQLGEVMAELAERQGARYRDIIGDDLLAGNLPAIHAVGRAAGQAPRLLMLDWGEDSNPGVTLVGKGVCFDSGGLDLKSASGMRLMKKDMGGGAHVIALAEAIMDAGLPIRLRVLVPAVENAVSAGAYRPGDIVATRAGLSVEIGNTDAEGRVVLCDALTMACEANPDLIIDYATLTGAARVALGPDLPPLFGNDPDVVAGLLDAADRVQDPLWHMPLYDPYDSDLDSPVADLCNVSESPFGGCITAALYLRRFIADDQAWCHLDVYGWNRSNRPGRPTGGEAFGIRATFDYLARRYG